MSFSEVSTEWEIFKMDLQNLKPLSEAEISYFTNSKKLLNIVIQPKDINQPGIFCLAVTDGEKKVSKT